MTKKNLWLVMLAIALVFGVMSCEKEPEDTEPDYTDPSTFYGTYKAIYKSNTTEITEITETINISEEIINIADNSESGLNAKKLVFKISGWEEANTPNKYSKDYPYAFKITGNITEQNGYIPSPTVPSGFENTLVDVSPKGNGSTCWIYIYFYAKKDDPDIYFIMSPFSKEAKDNGDLPVMDGSSSPEPRFYRNR